MFACVLGQVVFRYFLGEPLVWSDELARYLFVWASFLGWIIAARRRSHLAIDMARCGCRRAAGPCWRSSARWPASRSPRCSPATAWRIAAAQPRRRDDDAVLLDGRRLRDRAGRGASRSGSTPSRTRARRGGRSRSRRRRARDRADAVDPRGVVRRAVRRADDLRGDGARRASRSSSSPASRAS